MKYYNVERWTGKAWNKSLCSPYKTMAEVRKHLKDYSWHYTAENPYRITDFKPKKVKKYSAPKFTNWNANDDSMMVMSRSCSFK
jgi:hypothetical protein